MDLPVTVDLRVPNRERAFNFLIMSRLFILPICTLLIGACTMHELESIDKPNQEEPVVLSPKDTVLQFTAKNGEETTKTEWQSNGEIWWNVGDEIAVFYGASSKNRFTSTNSETVKTAVFSGTKVLLPVKPNRETLITSGLFTRTVRRVVVTVHLSS